MGALTSSFVNLPNETIGHAGTYALVYAALVTLGRAVPATPANTITRSALEAHLQTEAGVIVRSELDSDPEDRGYAGQTDADTADLINSPHPPKASLIFPGAEADGYVVSGGSSVLGVTATKFVGGGNADFNTLGVAGFSFCRFKNNTTTVGLRGAFQLILAAPSTNTLNFAAEFEAIPVNGDRFELFVIRNPELPARSFLILEDFPYAPNELTAADIGGARS